MGLLGTALRRRPWTWLSVALLCLAGGGYLIGRQVWAEIHVRRAETALDQSLRLRTGDHLAEARSHLECALNVRPDDARLHFLSAQAARRAGQADQAALHLRRAEELGWVKEAIDLEKVLAVAQQGELGEMEPLLLSFVRRDHPDKLLILEALVQGCLRTYQLPRALAYLNDWLEAQPDSARALVLRGETTLLMERTHDALADYSRAVELDPLDDEARLKLAELLLVLNRVDEAFTHFGRLEERQPDHAEVLYGLARTWMEKGKPDEAAVLLDRLLELQSDHAGALALRGTLALNANRPVEAERWLRRAVAAAPFESTILHTFHQCLLRNGHTDEAEKCLARITDIDTDRKRLDLLKRDITASPQDASLRCEMGRILLRNGQTKDGVRWLQSALRIDPRHGPSREALEENERRTVKSSAKP